MLCFGAVVELVRAELLAESAVFEHVISGAEDGGGNRPDGLVGPTP